MSKIKSAFLSLLTGLAIVTCENSPQNVERNPDPADVHIWIISTSDVSDSSAFVQAILNCESEISSSGFIYSSTNTSPRHSGNDCQYTSSNIFKNDTISATIENLQPGTVYYFAAFAMIEDSTYYSSVRTFGTNGKIVDIEGNTYKTTRIGDQYWMAENLKTTKYNDGSDIPKLQSDNDWKTDTSGAYCWYDNLDTYKDITGALYNWYAVNTNKLAPSGWHVPSKTEWLTLIEYIHNDGNTLKSTIGWQEPNGNSYGNGYDSYGFNALPGGERFAEAGYYTAWFLSMHEQATWWSMDEKDGDTLRAHNIRITFLSSQIMNYYYFKGCANSVRCVKDESVR